MVCRVADAVMPLSVDTKATIDAGLIVSIPTVGRGTACSVVGGYYELLVCASDTTSTYSNR